MIHSRKKKYLWLLKYRLMAIWKYMALLIHSITLEKGLIFSILLCGNYLKT